MDARDNLAAGPIELIVNPALSVDNPNIPLIRRAPRFSGSSSTMTSPSTSLRGSTSRSTRQDSLTPARRGSTSIRCTARAPALAGSSTGHQRSPIKLKVESGGLSRMFRAARGSAILADPRNDEHMIIAGLQAAFSCSTTTRRLPEKRHPRGTPRKCSSRRAASRRWHYQWIVLHELLPLFVVSPLSTRSFSRTPFLPAARRVFRSSFRARRIGSGTRMVRPSYRANITGDNGQAFFGMIFDPAGQGQADPVDLRGGARAPALHRLGDVLQLRLDSAAQRRPRWARMCDRQAHRRPHLHAAVHAALGYRLGKTAHFAAPAQPPAPGDLVAAFRPAPRAPNGNGAADSSELDELRGYGLGLERSTPLWYYVLKEARLRGNRATLGPVGARIVGEVLIGLLQYDEDATSLRTRCGSPPTGHHGRSDGGFRMIDFLAFAGVDPLSRARAGSV